MTANTRGIVYIAYGEKAMREAESAISQGRHGYETFLAGHGIPDKFVHHLYTPLSMAQTARHQKTQLDLISPYDHTLYLDADTRVTGDLQPGFDLLADGFDMVIVPSSNQGDDLLWHVSEEEREATFDECGYNPLQLQAGVFWFARTMRTKAFFQAWREEWLRWQGEDQGAFTRALRRSPLKLWLLGRPFNGGPVIQHHFGACR